ncbi:trigger factor [Clostridiaceae bacterium HSG29]|nr:trigger factor [Clostridiaceae bacterium HSG29]
MKIELKSNEKNVAKFEVVVENAKFQEAVTKAFKQNQKKFNLQGFRKGKAPRKMIELNYGVEVFFEDAVNILLPEVYSNGLDELKLEPVDRPNLDIVEIGNDKDLVLTFEVTVRPEVKLGQYKGVEIESIDTVVTDEDVDKELETLRGQNARLVNVEDRAVELNDKVIIDYAGTLDGELFDGGSAKGHELEIGSNTFIPGFEDQLIGANIGDEVEVNVTFPEDYHAEEMAAKEVIFKVNVLSIKVKELPELDDDFAIDTTEFDTLDEYRNDLKEKMQLSANESAERANRDRVIEKCVENMEVEIPEVMVDQEVEDMVNNFEQQLSQQGLNIEQYAQFTGGSLDDLKASMRKDALIRVETGLLFDAVVTAESIEATEEDLEEEYKKFADAQDKTVEEIKTLFARNTDYLKDSIVSRKTVDFLVDNANIK